MKWTLIIWLFLVSGFYTSTYAQTYPYAELTPTLDAGYVSIDANKLRFRYEEKYTEGNLDFQIYTYQRTALVTPGSIVLTKKLGVNYFEITLNTSPLSLTACPGGAPCYYILEVKDNKGQVWKLRFRY